jgi:hypothetical protein
MDLETIWYEVWLDDIRPIKVQRSTDDSVWIAGRRRKRLCDSYAYFPTWDEAKSYLVEQAQQKVDSCRRQLEYYKGKLGNAEGKKPPVSATPEQP